MNVDIDKTAPSVQVQGVVRAPVAQVWELFKPFGELMKWWNIYEWVKLEPPAKDEVGAVRSFKTKSGHSYRESLVVRDDAKHFERYDFISTDMPVSIAGIATTVAMVAAPDGTTHVTWSSWTEGGGLLRSRILSAQQETYQNAIADLDRHFHPALGTLRLTLTSAQGLKNGRIFPIDAYVLASLDGGVPQRSTERRFTSSPVFHDELSFPVLSKEGRLELSVWDANIGPDAPLGTLGLDLHTLRNGQSKLQTLPLDNGQGATLTFAAQLDLHDGDALPLTEQQEALNHLAVIDGILQKLGAKAMALAQQFAQGPQKTYGYARYLRSPQLPDVPLEKLPRMVSGLPPEQALSPHKLSRMFERALEYAYSQAQFLERAAANPKDPFLAFFGGYVKAPQYIVDHADEDAELARQFIQGVGPMVIRRVTELTQVPKAMAGVTPGSKTLESLIADKGLFLLDYEALASLQRYRDMVFYAPQVLVYKETLAGGESRLNLAAIQLTRDEGDNTVYVAGKTPPLRWKLAKLHVACADNQYHQWLFHLGYSHLAIEPFAIAAHNALPPTHPIGRLLAPHFQDTLGINFLARETLVSDIAPFTDRTFATGTAQALEMFLGAWEKYDFFARAFPAELAARGFDEARSDGLDGYYFRDDGFLLWNALGRYVEAIVSHFYADDAAVAADAALQAWAAESADPQRAAIPGFPTSFGGRELLTRTLQTLVWSVSAQHSAVNFPQFEYLSYVPNRPDSLFREMPPGMDEIEAAYLTAALPSPVISHFQISFAWLLSTPSDHTLLDVDLFEDVFPLRATLEEVSSVIRERNAALQKQGKPIYPFLQPENVAASVDI